jgi:hypothetical protein
LKPLVSGSVHGVGVGVGVYVAVGVSVGVYVAVGVGVGVQVGVGVIVGVLVGVGVSDGLPGLPVVAVEVSPRLVAVGEITPLEVVAVD